MLEGVVVMALEGRETRQRFGLDGFIQQALNVAIQLFEMLFDCRTDLQWQLGQHVRPILRGLVANRLRRFGHQVVHRLQITHVGGAQSFRDEAGGLHVIGDAVQDVHEVEATRAEGRQVLVAQWRAARQQASMAAKLSAARNWAAAKKQWQLAADRYAALDDLPGQAIALHNLRDAAKTAPTQPALDAYTLNAIRV